MPVPRVIPELDELRTLIGQGYTHQDIADLTEQRTGQRVTRGAVSSAVSRAGLSKPMNRYKDYLPWKVKIEHAKHYAARMLRLMGRLDTDGQLSELDRSRLDSWLKWLEEERCVVAYVPELEEGFIYMPRQAGRPRKIPINPLTIRSKDLQGGGA